MTWKLFIDDERFPAGDETQWVICRNQEEVMRQVEARGFPAHISFDHDLGDNVPSGFDITKWLIEQVMDEKHALPSDFTYTVHSMNPIGAENISAYWDNFLRFHADNDVRTRCET